MKVGEASVLPWRWMENAVPFAADKLRQIAADARRNRV
jgi:hypothetical protein